MQGRRKCYAVKQPDWVSSLVALSTSARATRFPARKINQWRCISSSANQNVDRPLTTETMYLMSRLPYLVVEMPDESSRFASTAKLLVSSEYFTKDAVQQISSQQRSHVANQSLRVIGSAVQQLCLVDEPDHTNALVTPATIYPLARAWPNKVRYFAHSGADRATPARLRSRAEGRLSPSAHKGGAPARSRRLSG